MKRGKQSYKESAERKLLELWEPGDGFGPPVGCIATTYTFDAAFFEEECLTRFASVQSDPNENDRVYVIEREEKLSQCFAAVIVDQAHAPRFRSLRWQVLVARVARGIQHAKLSLLVWQHRIRVLIGSANLTNPGYRSNYENVAVLEFGPDGDDSAPLELLEQVLEFLEQIRVLAAGADAASGPQAGALRFLQGVRRQTKSWPRRGWPRGEPRAVLVPIRPGEPSLFAQLGGLATGPPYHSAWVQSPFFDDGDGAKRVVSALVSILGKRGERSLSFGAAGNRLTDGTIEYSVPEVLRQPFIDRTNHRFTYVQSPQPRALHAKSIWIERDDAAIYCVGSSNFTCAGTGLAKGAGNFELNVAYVMPDLKAAFVQICKTTYPPETEVDPDNATFLAPGDRTSDGADVAGLPMEFGEATFDPGPPPVVRCEIAPGSARAFAIATPDGDVLLTESGWKATGARGVVSLPWTSPRAPSHLVVTWSSEEGERVSVWPVNVVDPSKLPPPDELRALALEELLQVLTSASPPHETIAKILARRSDAKKRRLASELDPHRRIDTKGFLLQRMRRFAIALEGLRERLERPVYSREALTWRLSGPFGVTVLAQRLAEEEKDGAAFMIAELARTVAAATIPPAGELVSKEIRRSVGEAIEKLQSLAEQHPAPPNLAAYVKRAFLELST